MVSWPTRKELKAKAPQIIAVTIVLVAVLLILFDTLEDVVIEGIPFAGTPLAALLNIVVVITKGVTNIVSSLGYVGIFVLLFLESTSLPIPSEVILPFCGYLVLLGKLDLWITVLVSTVAGIAGCLVDYYIGMKGLDLLARRKPLSDLLYSQGRLAMAQNWFNKYGSTAVFLSRLAPGFRTLVSFPAGAVRMPLTKFIAFTAAGCLVWDVVLIYAGFYVGSKWREVVAVSRYLIIVVSIAAIVAIVVFLVIRSRGRKNRPKT